MVEEVEVKGSDIWDVPNKVPDVIRQQSVDGVSAWQQYLPADWQERQLIVIDCGCHLGSVRLAMHELGVEGKSTVYLGLDPVLGDQCRENLAHKGLLGPMCQVQMKGIAPRPVLTFSVIEGREHMGWSSAMVDEHVHATSVTKELPCVPLQFLGAWAYQRRELGCVVVLKIDVEAAEYLWSWPEWVDNLRFLAHQVEPHEFLVDFEPHGANVDILKSFAGSAHPYWANMADQYDFRGARRAIEESVQSLGDWSWVEGGRYIVRVENLEA